MEPLVRTICSCPNCTLSGDTPDPPGAILTFAAGCEGECECEACGFRAELFADRRAARAAHSAYLSDRDVIVADLTPLPGRRGFVVAHTRMLLV